MRKTETDLFGHPIVVQASFRTDGRVRKIGYPARPSTGPKGQRCNTCENAVRVLSGGSRSWKCQVMARSWTQGPETDIHPGAPACRDWVRKVWKNRPIP